MYAKKEADTENPEAGDVWTWVAICEDSKLVATWWIGDRTYDTGVVFMEDLASRMAGPIQLTTDGLSAYLEAVNDAFGDWKVDHRILKRKYPKATTARTSYVERQYLTMRMNTRRYVRATNAFSKKLVNHAHAVALHGLQLLPSPQIAERADTRSSRRCHQPPVGLHRYHPAR